MNAAGVVHSTPSHETSTQRVIRLRCRVRLKAARYRKESAATGNNTRVWVSLYSIAIAVVAMVEGENSFRMEKL